MDINALLSPDSSPAGESSNTASNSPRRARPIRPSGGKRTSSNLSQEITRSPERDASRFGSRPVSGYGAPAGMQQPFPPMQTISESAPGFRPLQQPPTSNPAPQTSSQIPYGGYGQQETPLSHRHSSTPQMETLADLASMQNRTSRNNSATSIRQSDIVEAQRSPSLMQSVSQPPMIRNRSGQSLADLTMAEAPSQTPPPRNFTSNALSETEAQTVTDLLNYLSENSYAYDSHVQLIKLLHKGFLAHVYPLVEAVDAAPGDPHGYGLLAELRQAREAMDTRFAVGEDLWLEWLSDEELLARTGEERINVTELYQKAEKDEPASMRLWQAYADWVQSNHAACNNLDGADQAGWTDDDKELCRELFTRDMLMTVLEQGVAATQWRVDDSHLIWNRYAKLVQEDLPASPTAADVERIRNLYMHRLQMPHATSNDTKQAFWPIINRIDPENWEEVMAQVDEVAEPAKKQVALRDEHELTVQCASEAGDQQALFAAFSSYLQWERKYQKRGAFATELRCAVFERALLRFPTYTEWWLDYIDVVTSSGISASILPLIERATRHCPWSGDLWAKRILRSDVEGKPHVEIEGTKHRATNSGLLDVGGMEELLKVLQQWCSYLRRHAFSTTSSEDDLDTAEVGITSALEDVHQAGQTIYGKDFKGDPLYRLETIQVKFYTEARRLDDARLIYQRIAPQHKDSAAFWAKYYDWEIWMWALERMSEKHRIETVENGPHLATAVIRDALKQRNLDWPEQVLELFLNHFQQHESGENLQAAMIEAREFSKHLAIRREKEAEAAVQQQPTVTETQPSTGEKRKADDAIPNGESHKKPKKENAPVSGPANGEPPSSASAQVKRDREHNTVTVRNLPLDVQEVDVKKFFRDVGQPLSINVLQDKANDTASATVEFGSHEDVLAAKTRNGRELNGRETRISSGSQNTLYVANYPPEYDEAAIRALFDSYGEIISVRFPSLKFNNRRRFCYVQFLTEDMARATEAAMDNKVLGGQHKLVARISNPDAKKQRSGAQAEGREIFVKNLEREASEKEVKEFFLQYGNVVSMNLVKLVNGKRTGTAFIVFSSAEDANAALAANNKPFNDRILHVEISGAKAEGRTAPLDRARKTDIIIKPAASASPEPDAANGRRGSDVSMASASQPNEEAYKTARERKVAIFNLPDTVNDARIRAAMEQHGPIVKIQLRRGDNGAIVEFANVRDAFNVREGVDCSALGPNVKTGDVADLLSKAKRQQAAKPSAGGTAPALAFGSSMRPPTLGRPGQRGGGRRGGLGFKRGGGFAAAKSNTAAEDEGAEQATSKGTASGRSNADFRAMLEQSKNNGEAAETETKDEE